MAKKGYTSGLGIRLQKVFDAAKTNARIGLDKKPHFVPLDMSVLGPTLRHILGDRLEEFYQEILNQLKLTNFNILSLTALNSLNIIEIRNTLKIKPIIIEYNKVPCGVLFSSYSSVGSNFFTPILNNALAAFAVSGGFDIGHLVSETKLAKSPLQIKLEELKGLLSVYSESKNATKVNKYVINKLVIHLMTLYKTSPDLAKKELKETYGITKDYDSILSSTDTLSSVIGQKLKKTTYKSLGKGNEAYFNLINNRLNDTYNTLLDKSSYGTTIVNLDLIKNIGPTLSRIDANITIIQDRAENQKEYGSKIEGAINSFVKSSIIGEVLASERFSPSLKDHTEELIISRLLGKSVKSINSKKLEQLDISLPKSKSITKSNNIKIKPSKASLPTLRNIQGQFTSVTKLESLIRAQLRPTIVKNMHRPNLEYQSGHFADSVKLESISRARDGALSAFLSYMRYPYATFERDGKQGKKGYYPSRLIEGSVREIASKLVRDRMRVVIQ